MSQYTIGDSTNFFDNRSFFDVSCSDPVADTCSQLLTWLSPLEPSLRHWEIQERRVKDIGGWFLQTEEFERWCELSEEGEDDKAVLFCYGNPGVGKTFISSLVVDRLCDQARVQNTIVSCFYFDFAARKEQSATSVLGSLLKQIVGGMERIPEEISRTFREKRKTIGGCRAQLMDMVKMLQAVTSSQPTIMCIDALDECAGVERVRLLDSLKEILEESPGTRIFLTGRPYIGAEIEGRLTGQVAYVFISPNRDDIITYLLVRLGQDRTPEAMDEILAAEILEKIPETMSEMFLLVSLNLEAILRESTIYRRRERLSNMISGVGLRDAYGATIDRIKAQDGDKSRLGMAALMWISHAPRPLRTDELCHALAIELGSTDFNASNLPLISTLVGCCQGLIIVDEEASTVLQIHFTLREYLSARPDTFSRPHSTMAEICLTYLNCKQVKAISADTAPDMLDTPFLEYCSIYWGVHAKRGFSDRVMLLTLELFREYDDHISTKLLLDQVEHPDHRDASGGLNSDPSGDSSHSFRFSGLHCASFFGIAEAVSELIKMGCCDIDEADSREYSPLAWAACNGHEEVVGILVGQGGANPNQPANYGRTPLLYAAWGGHDGVVKTLLWWEEVDPDASDHSGQTPLSYAALRGHEGVVKMLLQREEVNPDRESHMGETPLWLAACGGHDEVVKILLGREEVDPDTPDIWGQTPLSYAAWFGREEVVKLLLEREEVRPDAPAVGVNGQTPLLLAAWFGHEGVVKMLLERAEVDPNKPNYSGRTPLVYAAEYGHEQVVKILLGHEEVDPNKPDTSGQTPLTYASRNGYTGVVKILLGGENTNSDGPVATTQHIVWRG